MLKMRLAGQTYQAIANEAGISRQRVQQILSPPPAIRRLIVKRSRGNCQDCGIRVGSSGHVHHMGDITIEAYDDIDSLQLLCPSCHRKAHEFDYSTTPELAEPLDQYVCKCNCGYEWIPRSIRKPARCPKCQSRNWNKPKGG